MSKTSSLGEHPEIQSEGGKSSQAESALEGLLWEDDNDSSGDQEAAPVSEISKPPSINAALTSLNEEGKKSAAVPAKGKQSDETIENLVSLFRDFLEAAPNPSASNHTHITQRTTAGRKRFFGLNKSLSPETGSNNRYDYEQKYPRDRYGEEVAENARVWLTYLDEAEVFDRERVEGWKETADVLLVFAGLFSGVITTFVSQASQNLQQDNTQVTVSLLFETNQILRAQFSGVPISHVPNSTLTPTSPFTPSTNALLVNALWFTSLAITLSTALFAVLAKQWLYYYLTSIPGTANEKTRARQLRFKGFKLWKVGAIVDLLPILLHLAVGSFLVGIIILLFPLDIRIAWTILIITGITYTLYFISVILPIRYPECPYTTSLTIYVGILFFCLQNVLRWLSAISDKGFRALRRRISSQAPNSIQRLLHHIDNLFRQGFCLISKLVDLIGCGFQGFRPTISTKKFPEFTNWREENIKKAVKTAAFLDFEALRWLYATSPNRSVRRIIARCVAVHPSIGQEFGSVVCYNLSQTLEVSETNIVDLRYGLCLDHLAWDHNVPHWRLLQTIPEVVESQLEEAEYRSCSRIAENVLAYNYDQILNDVNDDLKLPLVTWRYFLEQAPKNATMAAHILIFKERGLFSWRYDPNCETIRNTGVVSFRDIDKERGWWKFDYLFRFFCIFTKPDYSRDKAFNTRYLLLVSIYRNLTSDQPLIADKEQRQSFLLGLFDDFRVWLPHSNQDILHEDYLSFFKDICCADAFWSESMTDDVRLMAVACLDSIWDPMNTEIANCFHSTECHDLSLIYQWYSRDDLHSHLSRKTPLIFALLLKPRNYRHLSTILLKDSNAVSHFSTCLQNSWNFYTIHDGRECMYSNLMDLLKSVNPKTPLFTILYNSFVLAQTWGFLGFQKSDAEQFILVVKPKLDQESLDELYAAMIERAQFDEVSNYLAQKLGHRKNAKTLDPLEVPECATDKDHDIEEHAQVHGANERKGFHSIAHWIKKAFGSVWSNTRIRSARFTSETELQDL